VGAPRAPGDYSGEPSGGSSGSLVGHFGVQGVPRGGLGAVQKQDRKRMECNRGSTAPQEGPVKILPKSGAWKSLKI